MARVPRVVTAALLLFVGTTSFGLANEGWLLLLPPIDWGEVTALPANEQGEPVYGYKLLSVMKVGAVRKQAPLVEWEQFMAFDTALDCETARNTRSEKTERQRESLEKNATGLNESRGRRWVHTCSQGKRGRVDASRRPWFIHLNRD